MSFARIRQFLSELKHRRVFRVAGLYGVAAWVIIQVAATVFPVLQLPGWTVKLVVALALLGFPIALSLAWAFDLHVTAAPSKLIDVVRTTEPVSVRRGRARHTPWLRRALAVVLIGIVGAGGWASWRSRGSSTTKAERASPMLVAVLPFDVRAASSESYLHDGMVSLLAVRLDGAGGLRSVDPQALLRSAVAEGAVNAAGAASVASRYGAGLFVLGSVVGGTGRIQISASLYETAGQGNPVMTASAEGPADSVFSMADAIAIQLLSTRAGSEAAVGRTAALTTSSLSALKAYLEGERAYRMGQWGLAVDAFTRATAADTAFALAYLRLAEAAAWNSDRPQANMASAAAERFAARLSPRYRQILAAYAAYRHDDLNTEQLYRSILANYPQDPEAWFGLGEALYHHNGIRGRSISEAREPFEKALALDPDNESYLVHLRELACSDGRLRDLPRLMPPGPPLDTTDPLLNGNMAALGGTPTERDRALARLRGAVYAEFTRTVNWSISCAPSEVLPAIFSLADWRLGQADSADWFGFKYTLETVRGRWISARAALLHASPPYDALLFERSRSLLDPFSVPPIEELRQTRASLVSLELPRSPKNADGSADTLNTAPEERLYWAGMISVKLGDVPGALVFAARLEHLPPTSPAAWMSAQTFLPNLRAYTLAGAGRRAEALRVLEELDSTWIARKLPVEPFGGPRQHWLRAEILHEMGRDP